MSGIRWRPVLPVPELTQQEYEALEVAAQDARDAFLTALVKAPRVRAAWELLQGAERKAREARRARREAEVLE